MALPHDVWEDLSGHCHGASSSCNVIVATSSQMFWGFCQTIVVTGQFPLRLHFLKGHLSSDPWSWLIVQLVSATKLNNFSLSATMAATWLLRQPFYSASVTSIPSFWAEERGLTRRRAQWWLCSLGCEPGWSFHWGRCMYRQKLFQFTYIYIFQRYSALNVVM